MSKPALVLTAVALSGCSMFNPYRQAADTSGGSISATTGQPTGVSFAGGLKEALDQADAQRAEYLASMGSHARTRNGSTVALFGLTAWGLYRAILPDRTPAVDRQILRIGVAAGATYGIGDFFVNREHEAAYAQGYRALTCLMVQQRPLLMTQRSGGVFAAEGDAERFRASLDALQGSIDALDAATVRAQIWIGRYDALNTLRGKEIKLAVAALQNARRALAEGRKLDQTVRTSGYGLRRRMDLIVAKVNEEVQRSLKDIPMLSATLQQVSNASKAFKSIGAGTEADQGGAGPSEEDQKESPPPKVKDGATPVDDDASKAAAAAKKSPATKSLDDRVKGLERQYASPAATPAKPPMPEWKIDEKAPHDELADLISAVWRTRRPVAQALVDFQSLTRSVRAVEECRSLAAGTISIVPDDDIQAQRGGVYEFSITSAAGVPNISLQGNPGSFDPPARALETSLSGTTIIARVRVGAAAPEGALRLLVTDANGRAADTVTLHVPAVKPAADAKP